MKTFILIKDVYINKKTAEMLNWGKIISLIQAMLVEKKFLDQYNIDYKFTNDLPPTFGGKKSKITII